MRLQSSRICSGFPCSHLYKVMRIKPKFDKTYLIRYSRSRDVQSTEVIETTWAQLHTLIADTFKDRFLRPATAGRASATKIQVVELDNVNKKSRLLEFVHTKDGRDFSRTYAMVYNLSPREVRIRLEKQISE